MKIIKWLNFYFILLFLFSCTNDLSLADGETWFNTNKEAALMLKQQLLDNPAIKRIEPKLRLKFVPKYKKFTQTDEEEYKKIMEASALLGIENISVSRDGGVISGDLISIKYTLKTKGIVASGGEALSVTYIFDTSIIDVFKSHGDNLKALDEAGWYILHYKER